MRPPEVDIIIRANGEPIVKVHCGLKRPSPKRNHDLRLTTQQIVPPQESMTRVLWLSANPQTKASLDLEKEIRDVEDQLQAARYGEQVEIKHVMAARPFDLIHAVSDSHPGILHFSGHSSDQGILLRDDDGGCTVATADWLRNLLDGRGVRLVVLNSCCSRVQAEAISTVVPCVIGTTQMLEDSAAAIFSQMFYRRLADGSSIRLAFRDARLSVEIKAGHEDYVEYGGEALDKPIVHG